MIAAQHDSMGIQAALQAQGRVHKSIRGGEPGTIIGKSFPRHAAAAAAVTWSLPSSESCRYAAFHGLHSVAWRHQIDLMDLHTGKSSSIFAIDVEWLEWIPTPIWAPSGTTASPDPNERPREGFSSSSPSAVRPSANTPDNLTGVRLLVCVRSGDLQDGTTQFSLLMYHWDGTSQPEIIWRKFGCRFHRVLSITKAKHLHLSPDCRQFLWQGPRYKFEVVDLSAQQIRSTQPLPFTPVVKQALQAGDCDSELCTIGWSACGKLIAAVIVCMCPVQDRREFWGGMLHSFLHIWHAGAGQLLLSLDVARDIFGLPQPFLTPRSHCDVQHLDASWSPAVHPHQAPRLAMVFTGRCRQQGHHLVIGRMLEVLSPHGQAAGMEVPAPWHRESMELEPICEANALGRPVVQWSPDGSHVWVAHCRICSLLNRCGQHICSASSIKLHPRPQWSISEGGVHCLCRERTNTEGRSSWIVATAPPTRTAARSKTPGSASCGQDGDSDWCQVLKQPDLC